MKKKTRVTILLVCIACFLVLAPILVLYSMGYRFDVEKMKITATGGIYVRTYPVAEKIIIDSKTIDKPGIFSNSIFQQSLLPNSHSVLIQKTGYYDYSKSLVVKENQVTKLENVLLFKKDMQFDTIKDTTQSPFISKDKYIIKTNNLYSVDQKTTAVLKNLVAFYVDGNNITWLGTDGFLYKLDMSSSTTVVQKNAAKITTSAIKINKKGLYKIVSGGQNMFVVADGSLLKLNTQTNILEKFADSAKDAKISSDNKNIIYYNDNDIYIASLEDATIPHFKLNSSANKIGNCIWLNNDYIIFTAGNKIVISEIDYRDNINKITLPDSLNLVSPEISFNQQEGKFYILSQKILLASEKITQ